MDLRLIVPNDVAVIPAVRSFVAASAEIAGFDGGELLKFSLIAEEAFVYILRTSFEEEDIFSIEIVTKADNLNFFVSFFDKGLPFGKKELDNADDLGKLQLTIIRNNCDKLEWINHGRDGKELRIKFTRPKKDITQYEIIVPSIKKEPSNDISVELLNPEDAYQISQIIYKTYGYTYPNDDMYYPEIIENLNKEGRLVSVVAIDKAYNRIVGHYAIERDNLGDVAELGQAVIEPAYRGKNLLAKMRAKLEETAKKLKIKGLYSQPVTSHTKTQKINEKFNSKACGISFGLVPREFNYKKMEIKPLSERETCFMYFKPLVYKKRYVFIPHRHENIIREIYENLGMEYEKPKKEILVKKSIIDSKYNASWGFGTINVLSVGKELALSIKSSFTQLRISTQAEVIFLNITINDSSIDDFLDDIEGLGFFFCGIIPYAVEGKDIIRFQYLNTSINTTRIKVYGKFAKKIFDYSVEMMHSALGIKE